MEKLIKQLEQGQDYFGSGVYNTNEFKTFARRFHKILKKELELRGCTEFQANTGHFDLSGYFNKDGQWWYWNLGDVRWGMGQPNMLYRTAKSTKDYTGGHNQYVIVSEDMFAQMNI